jgi:hypothetical protein
MSPLSIIEHFDVLENTLPGFCPCLISIIIHVFGLECMEKALSNWSSSAEPFDRGNPLLEILEYQIKNKLSYGEGYGAATFGVKLGPNI